MSVGSPGRDMHTQQRSRTTLLLSNGGFIVFFNAFSSSPAIIPSIEDPLFPAVVSWPPHTWPHHTWPPAAWQTWPAPPLPPAPTTLSWPPPPGHRELVAPSGRPLLGVQTNLKLSKIIRLAVWQGSQKNLFIHRLFMMIAHQYVTIRFMLMISQVHLPGNPAGSPVFSRPLLS